MFARSEVDGAIATLQFFNEKVAKLMDLKFVAEITTQPGGAIVQYDRGKGWDSVFVGPSDETVDPVVLTLRFFMQNNERTSIQNVRRLYDQYDTPSSLRTSFETLADNLNASLDQPTNVFVEVRQALTYRDVLNIFIYGSLTHANPRWNKTYTDLRTTPFFPILQNDFVTTLAYFIRILSQMSRVNEQLLKHLRGTSDA